MRAVTYSLITLVDMQTLESPVDAYRGLADEPRKRYHGTKIWMCNQWHAENNKKIIIRKKMHSSALPGYNPPLVFHGSDEFPLDRKGEVYIL